MINLALSLLSAAVAFFAFHLAGVPWLGAAYFFLARRTIRQLEAVMQQAQKELQGRKFDRAIAVMQAAFPLARWQFLVEGQLNAQIGTLLYIQKKFDEAEPFLKKAFIKM